MDLDREGAEIPKKVYCCKKQRSDIACYRICLIIMVSGLLAMIGIFKRGNENNTEAISGPVTSTQATANEHQDFEKFTENFNLTEFIQRNNLTTEITENNFIFPQTFSISEADENRQTKLVDEVIDVEWRNHIFCVDPQNQECLKINFYKNPNTKSWTSIRNSRKYGPKKIECPPELGCSVFY